MSLSALTAPNFKPWLSVSGVPANVLSGVSTGTMVVTTAQSGSVIMAPQSTGSATLIQLPSPAVGLNYKVIFTTVADGTNSCSIGVGANGTAGTLGGVILNVAAGAFTSAIAVSSSNKLITRSATAANTAVGDYVDLWCDGTKYYARAVGMGAAATFSVSS